MNCLDAALAYAARGWQVVPLNWPIMVDGQLGCSCRRRLKCGSAGKHPWVRWKENGGSTDPTQIHEWWRWRWHSNVGILTGRDRSGLVVIDVDPDHGGGTTLEGLQADNGRMPATLAAVTGSGGRHLLFHCPPGEIRNSAGTIGPGVDVRGDGGLIVAAPSLHKSGSRYRWANWGTPLADVPEWILGRLEPKKRPGHAVLPPRNTARGTRYAEVALERAVADLHQLVGANGVRNTSLNATAYSLGRLVGSGLISADRVGHSLLEAGLAIGLGQVEAEDTISSGLRAGALRPKEVPA